MENEGMKTIDLFECLSEKEKARGKRKGIRMAKREDFIAKIYNLFKKQSKGGINEKKRTYCNGSKQTVQNALLPRMYG